jgi:Glycosyl hydrolases family 16
MNLDEIEELIRKYLSAGIAAIVIIVAPGTGAAPDGAPPDPEIRIIEPRTSPGADAGARPGDPEPDTDPPAGEPPAARLPADRAPAAEPRADEPADRTGAGGGDPGEDGSGEERATGAGSGSGGDTRGDTGESDSRSGTGTDTGAGAARDADPEPGSENESGPESENGADRGTGESERDSGTGTGSGSGDEPGGGRATDPEPESDGESGGASTADGETGAGARSDDDDDDTADEETGRSGTGAGGSARDSGPAATGSEPQASTGEGTTAAEVHGWGTPNREDDFSGGTDQWSIYDGPGHAGQGTRSPSAVSVESGILTITGDSSGTTAGMAWNPGQKYGRWEGRVRAPASDPSYNALLLLWPDAENFPVGGEIDFMEMLDHTRRTTDIFIHYGEDNSQVNGQVEIDGTEWHNWALEWTPEAITAYVDGEEWYRTTDTSIFPPGPMHLCVQLDWFPEGDSPQESYMYVDWVRQYSLDGAPETTDSRGTTDTTETTETTGDDSGGRDRTGTGDADDSEETGAGESEDTAGSSSSDDDGGGGEQEGNTGTRIREAIRRLFFWR